MPLQTALDIIHDIREAFPHISPHLTDSGRRFRDGSPSFIIGVYQGDLREHKRSWVLSSAWDWQEFLLLFSIFANL